MKSFSVNIILYASNSAEYNRPVTTINCEKKILKWFLHFEENTTVYSSTHSLAVQDCMMYKK